MNYNCHKIPVSLCTLRKYLVDLIFKSLMQFVFIVCQAEDYRNILKLSCRTFVLPHTKFFYKTKKGLVLVSLPHFLHVFLRKVFLLLYSIT